MIAGRTVLGLIPARGGSKGVPRKNIREVAGRPLIAWTVEAARASRYIDRLILSSDDAGIIDVARALGCEAPFVRPAELATDEADTLSVVRHALTALPERYVYLVLLQPTSPMRRTEDIDGAIEVCVSGNATACVSVCEADKSPFWMMQLRENNVVAPLFPPDRVPERRQDAPPIFVLNGAVYVARTEHLINGGTFLALQGPAERSGGGAGCTLGYPMPRDRSFDIDTELDIAIADFILSNRDDHGQIPAPRPG